MKGLAGVCASFGSSGLQQDLASLPFPEPPQPDLLWREKVLEPMFQQYVLKTGSFDTPNIQD